MKKWKRGVRGNGGMRGKGDYTSDLIRRTQMSCPLCSCRRESFHGGLVGMAWVGVWREQSLSLAGRMHMYVGGYMLIHMRDGGLALTAS